MSENREREREKKNYKKFDYRQRRELSLIFDVTQRYEYKK